MHFVIMGCGRVGSTLAHSLDALGHDVTIIDQSPEAFRRLAPNFSGHTVTGLGYDQDVLREANITTADAFAAVSSGDNSNIISARVARETFGVQRVAARIYDPQRAQVYERLGIPTVATARWTADRMLRHLVPDASPELWRDPTSSLAMVEVPLHQAWIGRSLRSLEETVGARVAFLMRFGLGTLPTDSTALQDGDQLFMLLTDKMIPTVSKMTGSAPEGGNI